MKERPILFSGAMVRGLLAGNKTQTRRIGKLQDPSLTELGVEYDTHATKGLEAIATYRAYPTGGTARHAICACPYGLPGDRLWVKETHARVPKAPISGIHYMADGPVPSISERHDAGLLKVYPSIHMPRWASRITLEITGIRVARLQDISEEDAKAEGVSPAEGNSQAAAIAAVFGFTKPLPYSTAFAQLWESINGPGSWDANPWVWVIEFRKL